LAFQPTLNQEDQNNGSKNELLAGQKLRSPARRTESDRTRCLPGGSRIEWDQWRDQWRADLLSPASYPQIPQTSQQEEGSNFKVLP
jgi:hypothetical protein